MLRNPRVRSVALVAGGALLAVVLLKLPFIGGAASSSPPLTEDRALENIGKQGNKVVNQFGKVAHDAAIQEDIASFAGNDPSLLLWKHAQYGLVDEMREDIKHGANVNLINSAD